MLEMECWESSANNMECGREGRVKRENLISEDNESKLNNSDTPISYLELR